MEEIKMATAGDQPAAEVAQRLKKLSIRQIHELLLQKKVTCVQLLNFFTSSLTPEVLELNLVAVTLYKEALERARSRDRELDQLLKNKAPNAQITLPPLFGIPISLKDVLDIQGYDTSLGSARFVDSPSPKNCSVVDAVLEAGAVPFVKTTVPQLLLINETNNFVWGRARSPWDSDRSPGGSSGGEAGLLSLGVSPIGIGTDGGGSVRIPATYCGLYSVRPTTKRFPPSAYKINGESRTHSHSFKSRGIKSSPRLLRGTCITALVRWGNRLGIVAR